MSKLLNLILILCSLSVYADNNVNNKDKEIISQKNNLKNILIKEELNKNDIEIIKKSISLEYGVDYEILEKKINLKLEGKDNIVEFFLLSCPHCQSLEAKLRLWLNTKNNETKMKKIPAVVESHEWIYDATIYQTLLQMNANNEVMNGLFDLYINQMNKYNLINNEKVVDDKILATPTIDDIYNYIELKGFKKEEFKKIMESENLKNNLADLQDVFISVNPESVPIFIVNGRFKILGLNAKNEEDLFKLIDILIIETDLL